MRNKAQVWVLEAMKLLQKRSPFPGLGIASDNGGEFINQHLIRFCEQHKITFTRTRPSRKNDNPYVEQKNYSVVRRAVGYARYEGERELELVNEFVRSAATADQLFQAGHEDGGQATSRVSDLEKV